MVSQGEARRHTQRAETDRDTETQRHEEMRTKTERSHKAWGLCVPTWFSSTCSGTPDSLAKQQ